MPDLVNFDYTSRDYASIREDLLSRARLLVPDWTAQDPGDFGTLMVELLAGIGDVLHLYIDTAAREAFLRTATLGRSVLDIANMLDYVPVSQSAATATVTFTRAAGVTGDVVIPLGTQVATQPATPVDQAVYFETTAEATLDELDDTIDVAVVEGRTVTDETLGQSYGLALQQYSLFHPGVIFGSVFVNVHEAAGGGVIQWLRVDRMLDVDMHSNVFTTYTNDNNITFVRFGDGITGRIPPTNVTLAAEYRYGVGSLGNVGAGAISVLVSDLPGIGTVSNAAAASGGEDRESIESLRIAIPQSLRAQDRAVTLDDYASLPLRVPGVTKASSDWDVGAPDDVLVYIAPTTPVAPSGDLKDAVEAYIEARKVLGKTVIVGDPSYVGINVTCTIQVEANRVQEWVKTAVEDALTALFDFDVMDFGERLKLGSAYKAIFETSGVEYFAITVFSKTVGAADIQLDPDEIAIPGTISVTAAGGIG